MGPVEQISMELRSELVYTICYYATDAKEAQAAQKTKTTAPKPCIKYAYQIHFPLEAE